MIIHSYQLSGDHNFPGHSHFHGLCLTNAAAKCTVQMIFFLQENLSACCRLPDGGYRLPFGVADESAAKSVKLTLTSASEPAAAGGELGQTSE